MMNVSNVMDKESQSVRLGLFFVGNVGGDGLVDEGVFVTILVVEPVNDHWDNFADVFFIKFELREVLDLAALI